MECYVDKTRRTTGSDPRYRPHPPAPAWIATRQDRQGPKCPSSDRHEDYPRRRVDAPPAETAQYRTCQTRRDPSPPPASHRNRQSRRPQPGGVMRIKECSEWRVCGQNCHRTVAAKAVTMRATHTILIVGPEPISWGKAYGSMAFRIGQARCH